MRGKDLVHTFEMMGDERMTFALCGALKIKPLREMYFLCKFLRCAYIDAVFLPYGSVQQFRELVYRLLSFDGCTLAVKVSKEPIMRIYEMAADNHPPADTFGRREVLSIGQEFEEIDKICFLTRPMNLAIRITSGEDRNEVLMVGVWRYPTGTEQALIESDDTLLLRFKPTIGEGC